VSSALGSSALVSSALVSSWSSIGWVILSSALMVVAVVAAVRVIGLRSLAKMSAFDFAVTVAIGSVIATTVATTTAVSDGVVAIVALLGAQWVIAQFRRRSFGNRLVDNRPVLLVRDGRFIDAALDDARITRADVYGHLRKRNVHSLADVRAVVLETTGDISVLAGGGPIDGALLDGVRQVDRPDGDD
jgi:uncharacterized membrane protein YcaP (DUF421 family)